MAAPAGAAVVRLSGRPARPGAGALRGLWRNDLTPGDSSRYFRDALRLVGPRQAQPRPGRPSTTSTTGRSRKLVGGDALVAENLHRAADRAGVTLLLLALARRLLPPAAALLVALLVGGPADQLRRALRGSPVRAAVPLAVALLLTDEPGPWRRGWAFALSCSPACSSATSFFELFVVVPCSAPAWSTRRGARRRPGRRGGWSRCSSSRSSPARPTRRGIDKGGELRDSSSAGSRLAICQHFALNYEQRHPEVSSTPSSTAGA